MPKLVGLTTAASGRQRRTKSRTSGDRGLAALAAAAALRPRAAIDRSFSESVFYCVPAGVAVCARSGLVNRTRSVMLKRARR